MKIENFIIYKKKNRKKLFETKENLYIKFFENL